MSEYSAQKSDKQRLSFGIEDESIGIKIKAYGDGWKLKYKSYKGFILESKSNEMYVDMLMGAKGVELRTEEHFDLGKLDRECIKNHTLSILCKKFADKWAKKSILMKFCIHIHCHTCHTFPTSPLKKKLIEVGLDLYTDHLKVKNIKEKTSVFFKKKEKKEEKGN